MTSYRRIVTVTIRSNTGFTYFSGHDDIVKTRKLNEAINYHIINAKMVESKLCTFSVICRNSKDVFYYAFYICILLKLLCVIFVRRSFWLYLCFYN